MPASGFSLDHFLPSLDCFTPPNPSPNANLNHAQ